MAQVIDAYMDFQRMFDRKMPNAIMEAGGKRFRKRAYFRGAAVVCKASVVLREERRDVQGQFADGQDNFGWLVVYEATAPNGRRAGGDGCCYAVEKAARWKCPHPHPEWPGKTEHFPATSCPDFDPSYVWRVRPPEATEHNVRAHAHTRAFNRSVSNLIGFGEVSAEAVSLEYIPEDEGLVLTPPSSGEPTVTYDPDDIPPEIYVPKGGPPISEPQRKRLWAIARNAGWEPDEIKNELIAKYGIDHTKNVPKTIYNAVVAHFEKGAPRHE